MSRVNRASELFFRNSGFCLPLVNLDAQHVSEERATELGDAFLGRACHLPADMSPTWCSPPTADSGSLGNCCLGKVSHTSDCEKRVDITFMEKQAGWHFISGRDLDLALEWCWWTWSILMEGKKSVVGIKIIRFVICLEVQELWDINDWYLYNWSLFLTCYIWGSRWIICNHM